MNAVHSIMVNLRNVHAAALARPLDCYGAACIIVPIAELTLHCRCPVGLMKTSTGTKRRRNMNKDLVKGLAIGGAVGLGVGAAGAFAFYKFSWEKKHAQIFNDELEELQSRIEKKAQEGYEEGIHRAQLEYSRKIEPSEYAYQLPEIDDEDPKRSPEPEPEPEEPKAEPVTPAPAAEVGDHPFLKMYGEGVRTQDLNQEIYQDEATYLVDPAAMEHPTEDPTDEELESQLQMNPGRLMTSPSGQATVRLLPYEEYLSLDTDTEMLSMCYYDEDDVVAYYDNDEVTDDTGVIDAVRPFTSQFYTDPGSNDPNVMYLMLYEFNTCVELIRIHNSYTRYTGQV